MRSKRSPQLVELLLGLKNGHQPPGASHDGGANPVAHCRHRVEAGRRAGHFATPTCRFVEPWKFHGVSKPCLGGKIKKPRKGAFSFWRRDRDSNPGTPVRMLLEFQSSAFDRSAISP